MNMTAYDSMREANSSLYLNTTDNVLLSQIERENQRMQMKFQNLK